MLGAVQALLEDPHPDPALEQPDAQEQAHGTATDDQDIRH
jgi:hypothetical protein